MTGNDAEDVLALYRGYMRTGQTAARIAHLASDYPAFKATLGNTLVGFCYSNSFAPDVLELCNIYVDHRQHNLGIGSELIRLVHQAAIVDGFSAMILSNSQLYETLLPKRDPRSFYERHGYTVLLETPKTLIYSRALP